MIDRMTVHTDDPKDIEGRLDSFADDLLKRLHSSAAPRIAQVLHANASAMAPVKTGRLREGMEQVTTIDTSAMTVSADVTNAVEYVVPQEYGTGWKGDPDVAHTGKRTWFSYNPNFDPSKPNGPGNRKFLQWFPMEGRHFMRDALRDTEEIAMKYMVDDLKGVFK